jgi:hypothetical protein
MLLRIQMRDDTLTKCAWLRKYRWLSPEQRVISAKYSHYSRIAQSASTVCLSRLRSHFQFALSGQPLHSPYIVSSGQRATSCRKSSLSRPFPFHGLTPARAPWRGHSTPFNGYFDFRLSMLTVLSPFFLGVDSGSCPPGNSLGKTKMLEDRATLMRQRNRERTVILPSLYVTMLLISI